MRPPGTEPFARRGLIGGLRSLFSPMGTDRENDQAVVKGGRLHVGVSLIFVAALAFGGCVPRTTPPSGNQTKSGGESGSPPVGMERASPPPLPTWTPLPCAGVSIHPRTDIQAVIDAHRPGTTFCFAPGLYRLKVPIQPKSTDVLIGTRAVLNGSKLLTSFRFDGTYWTTSAHIPRSTATGSCSPGTYTGCEYNEGVYRDGRDLWQTTSLPISSGQFYFDYATDTIYLADNPANHTIEASWVPHAIRASRESNISVEGFVIEKFANPAQSGAIQTGSGRGWIIKGNEIRLNHGGGIYGSSSASLIAFNSVHDNGQLGIGLSYANDAGVKANEIAHNNTQGFSYQWEAGGTKFWSTTHLLVQGNYVHDNIGPGLWADNDNVHTTYQGNTVSGNSDAGILHEISYSATIRDNVVIGNGSARDTSWLWGSGIVISTSQNIAIYGNRVVDNMNGIGLIEQDRGTGKYGTYLTRDVHVYDNEIQTGGHTGVVRDNADDAVFSGGNRFANNTYCLASDSTAFAWADQFVDRTTWESFGQDTSASFVCPLP